MTRASKTDWQQTVAPDAPLKLDIAAAIAFPDGSMSASGLRNEHARGRLVIERVAGKDYTTLAHIARMRELCRRAVKDQDSGSARDAATNADGSPMQPSCSSATDDTRKAHDAALAIVQELKERSQPTSRESTSRPRRKGNVIHLRSRSRTRSRSTAET